MAGSSSSNHPCDRIMRMFKRALIYLSWLIRLALLLGVAALIIPRLITEVQSRNKIYTQTEAPYKQVAIVFGAGLGWNGQPTPVLRDRIATAVELFNSGRVNWLLLSGSQSESYSEPEAMRNLAVSLGVPIEAITLDIAGDRTYDTCFRAQSIYHIQSAILVTQRFHLPRALYICNQLGIQAVGVAADLREYRNLSLIYWNLRELPATLFAFLDVHLVHPAPALSILPRFSIPLH
jgi:SanA protein